jgi:hypothetical protein
MIDWKQIALRAFDANRVERQNMDVERRRLETLRTLTIAANSELERLIKRAIPFTTRALHREPGYGAGPGFVRIEVNISPREIMYYSGGDGRMVEAVGETVAREIVHEVAKLGILRSY